MPSRPGSRWNRDKLRSATPSDNVYFEGIADPARGERVPRCIRCGWPSTASSTLLVGVWTAGEQRYELALHKACLPDRDPTFDATVGDPLTVEAA